MNRNQNNYIILAAVIVTITILDVVIYKDNYQLSILLLIILGLLSFKQVINLSNNAKQKTFWLVTLAFVIVQMILIKCISIPHMFELLVVNNIIMLTRCTRFLFTPSTLMQNEKKDITNEKKDITYEELLSITRIILFINVLFCIPAHFMVAFTIHESKK